MPSIFEGNILMLNTTIIFKFANPPARHMRSLWIGMPRGREAYRV